LKSAKIKSPVSRSRPFSPFVFISIVSHGMFSRLPIG
jgi:hypothetical protein